MTTEDEIWLPNSNYPGYLISNYGNVKHRDTGKVLKLRKRGRKRDSIFVSMKVNKKWINRTISRLVFQTFMGELIPGLVIDHKDNDSSNNFYRNLQQITHRENTSKDKFRKDPTSKYVGVSYSKSNKNKPWRSRLYNGGRTEHLGLFATELEASSARETRLKQISNGG